MLQIKRSENSEGKPFLFHNLMVLSLSSNRTQRSYFKKCNPRKNAHHQLPIAKMKLLNVLNPKMIISRTIFVWHQGVLVD